MRAPPPVTVMLGPEPVWRGATAVLQALGAASGLFWVLSQCAGLAIGGSLAGRLASAGAGSPLAWMAGCAAVVAASVAAAWCGWLRGHHEALQLTWTGQCWELSRIRASSDDSAGATMDPQGCEPHVMLDLGGWMLLRLIVRGRTRGSCWVAASETRVGSSWHGLRVALHGATQAASVGPEART